MAQTVISKGLSVRDTERLTKKDQPPRRTAPVSEKAADTRALESDLAAAIGMQVTIDHQGDGGRLTIRYRSLEDLDALCQRLGGG